MLLFNESIKSPYTKQNYLQHLKKFQKFINAKTYDELTTIPSSKLQVLLEDYLVELKKTTNSNSISTMFLGVKHFFVMNRIKLDWEIIQKMYPQKTLTVKLRAWSKDDIQGMIQTARNKRDVALLHFLASTGARVGVFEHDLAIKHIKRMPDSCLGIKIYPKTLDEYWVFLTPQASVRLFDYLNERRKDGEVITGDSPIFRNIYRKSTVDVIKKLGWSGVRSVIYRSVSKSNANRAKYGFRYDVQASHGFRKYFNTTLKLNTNVNSNIVEKLMGHKNGLDGIYLTPTIEQCFAEFKKAIKDLTI